MTEFVLKVHPQQPTVFAGPLVFPPTALDAVLAEAVKRKKAGLSGKETIMVLAVNMPDPNKTVNCADGGP